MTRRAAILGTERPELIALMAGFCPGITVAPGRGRLFPRDALAWAAARRVVASKRIGPALRPLKLIQNASRHDALRRRLLVEGADLALIWNGLKGRAGLATEVARELGLPTVFFERAPLPGLMFVDSRGVNAGASVPRDRGFFRRWRATATDLRNWRSMAETLLPRPAAAGSRVGQAPRCDWSGEGRFIFVPLQVRRDTQVLRYGGWVGSVEAMIGLLSRTARALPQGWHLRLKEHPSETRGLTRTIAAHLGPQLRLDNETSSMDQLRASEGVLTINSSMGLHGFFHDKPVITLGEAFYAGAGLTATPADEAELAGLLAAPGGIGFDASARDDLMAFLVNDYFVPEVDLRAGRFGPADLAARDRRHAALM